MQIEIARAAYNSVQHLIQNDYQYSVDIRTNIDKDSYHITKSVDSLTTSMKIWSNYYKTEVPLVFISVDENGKEFLYDQLDSFNFLDAMPSDEKWDEHSKNGILGSGGTTVIGGKVNLLYWQILGSENPFTGTGNLKTGPHLFTHAIQSALYSEVSVSQTDLPAWFVEGQADFLGLISNSKSFEDYWNHRIDFFRTGFVPGGDITRKKLKSYSEKDWELCIYNSPEKFEGIPLVDEYYSGLMAYELLIYMLKEADIMDLYNEFPNTKDFYKIMEDMAHTSKLDFSKAVAPLLFDLGSRINVQ
jgi:hypothetical protein